MVELILGTIDYSTLLLFGVFVSAAFIGICLSKINSLILIGASCIILIMQIFSYYFLGMDETKMIYPLLTHLPIILILIFYFKQRVLPSIFAVMSAYLCCQVSKWMGILALEITNNEIISFSTRIIITVLSGVFIIKYISSSVTIILSKPTRTLLIFSILPAVYYIFDYGTTVYTDLLYSGSRVVSEFLPFILCISYLIFSLIYFKEYEERCEAEWHNRLMEIQKTQSLKEIDAIRRSEYEVSLIRHDMRHFLNNILSYIENEDSEKAMTYISGIIDATNKTALYKFCNNELVNMVLSSYESKMKDSNIKLQASVQIPKELPCSDIDFTSILANGLENAMQAVMLLDTEKRIIVLDLKMSNERLLLSIRNPYIKKPEIVNGLPITQDVGHGLGTKSIKYVTEKLKGNCQFDVDDTTFSLRVVL